MGSGFEHAALAVFTTLAPMGAASFIALAYAFAAGKVDDAAAKRVDKLTVIPAIVMLAGFIGAFLHLANPLAAFGVFGGVGSSPLSNEIVAAIAFCIVAVVYWALALAGKLPASGGARKALLIVLAVLSLVFAVFCGMAYMMDTIPTWNTPASIIEMVGYAIAGGAVVGFTVLGFARVELPENAAKIALGSVLAGVVIGVAGLAVQFAGLGSIRNIWGPASDLVPAFGLIIALFAACGIAAAALVMFAAKKKSPMLAAIACVVIAVGIFFARIAFYGTYMGIAL